SVMAASSIPSRMQRRGKGFKPRRPGGVKWAPEPAVQEPAVTEIRQEDFIQSVADALQYISYYHPVDYIRNLAAAYEREESPAAPMGGEDVAHAGVRRAYRLPENKLRASVLADPAGARRNTGDNTPAIVNFKVVPGGKVDVIVAAKGGGSEAKAKFAMLNPSDSVVDWVLKMVPTMGAGWCPPGMLGIGIGG